MSFGSYDIPTIIKIGLPAIGFLILGTILGFYWGRKKKAAIKHAVRLPRGRTTRDRLSAIYTLTASLINTLNYERVLEITLDMSAIAFNEPGANEDKLICAVLLFSEDELLIHKSRQLSNSDHKVPLPGKKGALAKILEKGEPLLITNIKNDPELQAVSGLLACASIYLIPLRSGRDVYGVLLFGHPTPNFFSLDNREVLEIISSQAISAMQNARLYNELEQEKERMAEAQEVARKKLARDLHDGPTQSVSAIAMRINFARRLMENDQEEAAEELLKIEELARGTTREIRHMLFTLRPLVLESQGLKAALESMSRKMAEVYEQNVIVDVDETTAAVFDMARLGVVFYIVEEAVNNARKHANAAHIWVRLKRGKPDIGLLEIEDDGVGFDINSVNKLYDSGNSLGLLTLKERAELINGDLYIESQIGKGTLVKVHIPYNKSGTERLRQGLT